MQRSDPPEQLHFVIPERLVVLLPKHAEVGGLHVDVSGLCEVEQQSGVSSLPSNRSPELAPVPYWNLTMAQHSS